MIVDKDAPIPNTIGIPAKASFVIKIKNKKGIIEAIDFSKKEGLPLIVIGEGTNIVPKNYTEAVIATLETKKVEVAKNWIEAEAGESWDKIVQLAVKNNLSGIEPLSWIPGKTGSAPIQNIGAYGTEISNCLETVEVFDRVKNEFLILNKKDCQFGYRESLFKKYPERFIVVSIRLKLSKEKPKIPQYKDVIEYFQIRENPSPTLTEIREAIIKIRKNKLPDPNTLPNAGSYFVNPFVNGQKIPAGKLIDEAGLKGAKIGRVQVFPKNALVLTNPDRVGFKEIMEAEKFIIEKVYQKFNITLKREPQIIG